MRNRRRRLSKTREDGEEEVELNLASIIDCFTVVLITYLLFTAAFISLAELDVSAVTIGSGDAGLAPAKTISVGMSENKCLKSKPRAARICPSAFPQKTATGISKDFNKGSAS